MIARVLVRSNILFCITVLSAFVIAREARAQRRGDLAPVAGCLELRTSLNGQLPGIFSRRVRLDTNVLLRFKSDSGPEERAFVLLDSAQQPGTVAEIAVRRSGGWLTGKLVAGWYKTASDSLVLFQTDGFDSQTIQLKKLAADSFSGKYLARTDVFDPANLPVWRPIWARRVPCA